MQPLIIRVTLNERPQGSILPYTYFDTIKGYPFMV